MNEQILAAVVAEISPLITNRAPGKIFQLSAATLAFDFRLPESRYLFISVEPNQPRLYLIKRTVRELEKQTLPPSPFVLTLRKQLSGSTLQNVTRDEGERIVRFHLSAANVVGDFHEVMLVAQLTGRTANLFFLDEAGRITATLRESRGEGQEIGMSYYPPVVTQPLSGPRKTNPPATQGIFNTFSEALDDYYLRKSAEQVFQSQANALLASLRQKAEKIRRLKTNLSNDLTAHGDPEEHKRVGDLLLANLATARREGNKVVLKDYYSEGEPELEIEVEENQSLSEAAQRRFARYGKARRAIQEIARRIAELDQELIRLQNEQAQINRIVAEHDTAGLEELKREPAGKKLPVKTKSGNDKREVSLTGIRSYRSSDQYEVLVGRAARDNDRLTFRIARPHDYWLHAADYPGSHVVVVNHQRKNELPHRTLVEAAQLAAFFSQARADTKVNVHCTQRKFITKPKGAAPGLVRLSQFRTLIVEPREVLERIK